MAKKENSLLWLALIVIVILGVGFLAIRLFSNSEVSADVVQGTEAAPETVVVSPVMSVDDGVSIVEPNQIVNYKIKINTREMMKVAMGLSSVDQVTEASIAQWNDVHHRDKFFLNGWMGNGALASGGAVLSAPNMQIELPRLNFAVTELTLTGSARITDKAVKKNTIKSTFRLNLRGCNPRECPLRLKTKLAEAIDQNVISYAKNEVDVSIGSYNVDDRNALADELRTFTVTYGNNGANVAGGTKLKFRFPENTFAVEGKTLSKETVEGRKYDFFTVNLGNLAANWGKGYYTFKAKPIALSSAVVNVTSYAEIITGSQDRDLSNNLLTTVNTVLSPTMDLWQAN